jgi:DNA-binding HxlR family transcriptional regulator
VTVRTWDPFQRDCPSRRLLDRIGDRWTVLIVGALDAGPRRSLQNPLMALERWAVENMDIVVAGQTSYDQRLAS